jgi:hypothetical protein
MLGSTGGQIDEIGLESQTLHNTRKPISLKLRLYTVSRSTDTAPRTIPDTQEPAAGESSKRRAIALNLRLRSPLCNDRNSRSSQNKASEEPKGFIPENCKQNKATSDLASKNAPKFIASLNNGYLAKDAYTPPSLFSANLEYLKSNMAEVMDGTTPKSKKTFLVRLPKKSTQIANTWIEPPSPDPNSTKGNLKPLGQVVSHPATAAQQPHLSDDILETFSRNAQYKTSKRRMTKMTQNPQLVSVNSENGSGSKEEPSSESNSQGTDHSSECKLLLGKPEGETEDPKNLKQCLSGFNVAKQDLTNQFKDLLNTNINKKVILDSSDPRKHRPSVDLMALSQHQKWGKVGVGVNKSDKFQSAKSILVKSTKFAPLGRNGTIKNSGKDQPASQDRSQSAKKKVVFAKNKMVLLFEKGQ